MYKNIHTLFRINVNNNNDDHMNEKSEAYKI